MTLNQTKTTTNDCHTDIETACAVPRFPRLFWAAAATFSVNMLIAAGIFSSPDLRVTMYGQDFDEYAVTAKPSPFTEVVDTKPVRKVRRAARLQPVAFEAAAAPAQETVAAYVPASYASGDDVYTEVERLNEYPRLSAAAKPVVAHERLIN